MQDAIKRLSAWAHPNHWEFFPYRVLFDLLEGILRVQEGYAEPLQTIEIIAHGSPSECDDVTTENAINFGESLKTVAGFGPGTQIYLSGCNTGLTMYGRCVSETLARATGATVYGARGYLFGTRAEGDDHCTATYSEDGYLYEAYPGAVDAEGTACWNCFSVPVLSEKSGGDMGVKLVSEKTSFTDLPKNVADEITRAIASAMLSDSAHSPKLRIAPDARILVDIDGAARTFEILAAGSILRDPVRNVVWKLNEGGPMLRTMLEMGRQESK